MWGIRRKDIQKIAEDAVDNVISDMVSSGKLTSLIDDAVFKVLRDIKDDQLVSHVGFVFMMALEIFDASKQAMKWDDAKKTASGILSQFLKDERVKFGGPGFDWTAGAAKEMAREYEISYWD